MVEDESSKSGRDFKAPKEEREFLREFIFTVPCTKLERQWIVYNYNRDENLRQKVRQISESKISLENFVEELRQGIDIDLLVYLQSPKLSPDGSGIMLNQEERGLIIANFGEYREKLIQMCLSNRNKNQEDFDKAFRSFNAKLRSSSKRRKDLKARRGTYKFVQNPELVLDSGQLAKVLFLNKVDIGKFKSDVVKSDWVKRHVDRILKTTNLVVQQALVESFVAEFPNHPD